METDVEGMPLIENVMSAGKPVLLVLGRLQVTKGSPLGDTLSLSCEASVGTSGSNN